MSQIQQQTPVPKKASKKKKHTTTSQPQASVDFDDILHDLERELKPLAERDDKPSGAAIDEVDLTRDHKRTTSTSHQPAQVITGAEDVRISALPLDALHHFLRFTQYLGRYDRRKERVAGLRLKLEYEKAQLADRERWRAESFEALSYEVHEASQRRAEATVIEAAPVPLILFDKVKAAMDRTQDDDQAVVAQARRVSKMEEAVKSAEARLHRVIDSMITSAKKSIDQSGISTTDSETLISVSTQAGSEPTSVDEKKRAAPPPIVEEYFDKLGMKNIMFERVANIEWERREELVRREILGDQSSDPGADLSEEYKLADEDYERDLLLANRELEEAMASFENVQRKCQKDDINPLSWATNHHDDDESDGNEDDETMVAPRRQAADAMPMTMSTIAPSLTPGRNTIAIGPDPDDPQGLIATEVYFDPKHHAADVKSSESVEMWMKDLPEHENKRVFLDSDLPTLGESEQPISKPSPASQPAAVGSLGQVATISPIDLNPSKANGETRTTTPQISNDPASEQCMDGQMLQDQSRVDSKIDTDTAVDQHALVDRAVSATVEELVNDSQHTVLGEDPASQQSTEMSSTSPTDARTSQMMTLAIEDMHNSMHMAEEGSRLNSGQKSTLLGVSNHVDQQSPTKDQRPSSKEQRPSSKKEAVVAVNPARRGSDVALSESSLSSMALWAQSVIRDYATPVRSTQKPASNSSAIDLTTTAEHERDGQSAKDGTRPPLEPEPWKPVPDVVYR